MGDLIVMTRPSRPSPAIVAAGTSADILFFTGVRYYAMPDVAAAVVAPADLAQPARRRSEKAKKTALARHLKRRAAEHHH